MAQELAVVNAFSVSRYQMREKAGLLRDAIRSQCSNVLKAQEKETGHAEE